MLEETHWVKFHYLSIGRVFFFFFQIFHKLKFCRAYNFDNIYEYTHVCIHMCSYMYVNSFLKASTSLWYDIIQ